MKIFFNKILQETFPIYYIKKNRYNLIEMIQNLNFIQKFKFSLVIFILKILFIIFAYCYSF